jgi:hypothetical protein
MSTMSYELCKNSDVVADGQYITVNIPVINDRELLSIEPLYYIAENIRQKLYKVSSNDKFNAERLDNDFNVIDTDIALDIELSKIRDNNKDDGEDNTLKPKQKILDIIYIISKYKSSGLYFRYKTVLFEMKTDILLDITKTPVQDKITGNIMIHSVYSIRFEQKDLSMFENFIQTTNEYTKKFLDISRPNNKISMYISSSE